VPLAEKAPASGGTMADLPDLIDAILNSFMLGTNRRDRFKPNGKHFRSITAAAGFSGGKIGSIPSDSNLLFPM